MLIVIAGITPRPRDERDSVQCRYVVVFRDVYYFRHVYTRRFFPWGILLTAAEIPSNYILERYFTHRPSLWVGTITFCWGVLMTLHGVVHNFASLLTLRLLMGAFEAGFFPAAVLIMNKWYLKFELSARVAIYYCGAAISGAFSGLLAYALAKMDGIAGVAGWRFVSL